MSTSNVELRNYVPLFSVTQPNVDLRNITSVCYLNSVRGIIGLLLLLLNFISGTYARNDKGPENT